MSLQAFYPVKTNGCNTEYEVLLRNILKRISIKWKCRKNNAPIYDHGTRVYILKKKSVLILKNKFPYQQNYVCCWI